MRRITSPHALALGATVLLAAALRFYGLAGHGFIYWDEGKFALEGIRFRDFLLGSSVSVNVGKPVGTAKPTHALLIGIADAVVGVHDYAALMLSATAGMVSVVLAYAIARTLFGRAVGLLSALFLAVSEYDVIYARSALSESDATAVFLAGVLVWVRVRRSSTRVLAGCLLGLAFTANYRMIVYCAVIVGLDLIQDYREIVGAGSAVTARRPTLAGTILRLAGHTLHWVAGLALFPTLWQLTDFIARSRGVVLFQSEITYRPMWYVEQTVYQLHEGKQSTTHFSPLPYLVWYTQREGPLIILIVAGLITAVLWIRSRSRAPAHWWVPAALVALPYLIYIFAPFVVPRNLAATVPFACMLAAVALVEVTRHLRSARAVISTRVIAAISLASLGVVQTSALLGERSGFARAAGFVEARGAGRIFVTNAAMGFYLRNTGAPCSPANLPRFPSELYPYLRDGFRYAVIDKYDRQSSKYIRSHITWTASYPLGSDAAGGENLVASENGYALKRNHYNDIVSVYFLDLSLLPAGSSKTGIVCTSAWR